jgi:hypothetical protein
MRIAYSHTAASASPAAAMLAAWKIVAGTWSPAALSRAVG